ncbi:hypothetical protein K2X33_13775 [bacterium]|nr:hypothetical protein [bacterium]
MFTPTFYKLSAAAGGCGAVRFLTLLSMALAFAAEGAKRSPRELSCPDLIAQSGRKEAREEIRRRIFDKATPGEERLGLVDALYSKIRTDSDALSSFRYQARRDSCPGKNAPRNECIPGLFARLYLASAGDFDSMMTSDVSRALSMDELQGFIFLNPAVPVRGLTLRGKAILDTLTRGITESPLIDADYVCALAGDIEMTQRPHPVPMFFHLLRNRLLGTMGAGALFRSSLETQALGDPRAIGERLAPWFKSGPILLSRDSFNRYLLGVHIGDFLHFKLDVLIQLDNTLIEHRFRFASRPDYPAGLQGHRFSIQNRQREVLARFTVGSNEVEILEAAKLQSERANFYLAWEGLAP